MNEIATTATPTALTPSTTDLLLDGNRQAAAAFTAGHLAAPPVRNLAIVTCMDARIEPLRQLGLGLGDTHLMRNAGGRVTDDVLRSLMVSTAALGVREVAVMQHLSCGMGKLSDAQLREKVLETTGFDPGALEFLSFTDIEASVRADVERVRNHPGVAAERVIGLVYDVATGLIHEVN